MKEMKYLYNENYVLPKKDIKGDIEGGRTFMLMNQKNQHCENG
jgi:hypothetical protein